jgi:hypothetical protein
MIAADFLHFGALAIVSFASTVILLRQFLGGELTGHSATARRHYRAILPHPHGRKPAGPGTHRTLAA